MSRSKELFLSMRIEETEEERRNSSSEYVDNVMVSKDKIMKPAKELCSEPVVSLPASFTNTNQQK